LFALLVVPWFVDVFGAVPKAFDYMVKGQVAGHILGTTIKNRRGSPFYFFGILAFGFLPWTVLLGWLWRPGHWRRLGTVQKEGWLFLSAVVLFTFALFSFTRDKLPAYILPLFPPLAVLIGVRWFNGPGCLIDDCPRPGIWRVAMVSPLLAMAAFPLAMRFVFNITGQDWLWPQFVFGVAGLVLLPFLGRGWTAAGCARVALALGCLNLWFVAVVIPRVETGLKGNQTLKPLASALWHEYRGGDTVVCWGRFPQVLPFYAVGVIDAAHRPYLGAVPMDGPPFEFPGNRERFGRLVLPDEAAFGRLLENPSRVLVVGFEGTYRHARLLAPQARLRFITQAGQWELFANQ
jgi:hypothetical protein